MRVDADNASKGGYARIHSAVAAVAIALLFAGCAPGDSPDVEGIGTVVYDTAPDTLVLRVEGGNASIAASPSSDGKLTVATAVEYTGSPPELLKEADQGGRVLRFIATCAWVPDGPCEVDYTVTLPPDVALMVVAPGSDATVTTTGLAGAQDIQAFGGSISVSDASGPLTLSLGRGDVHATGLSSSTVNVEAGMVPGPDVSLSFVDAPSLVTVTGSAIDIALPRLDGNAGYNVVGQGFDATFDIQVAYDGGSSHSVNVHPASGTATVRYTD